VDTLALRISHQSVEAREEPAPIGFVHLEHGDSRAVLLTPDEIDPEREYPLITVLHGAGRQDEMLVRACRAEPDARNALFLVPRSIQPTWDLITGAGRPDLDFLEFAYDLIYRRYPIDERRQAMIGYSDGASYALSIGLSNPSIFRAVMAWAAGFVAYDNAFVRDDDPKPDLFLEYGTHDEVFSFEQVALPMRASLEEAGYRVEFRVDEGGRHWPSGYFQGEALDWFAGIS
jgi:phospholipase/carboxylesterase